MVRYAAYASGHGEPVTRPSSSTSISADTKLRLLGENIHTILEGFFLPKTPISDPVTLCMRARSVGWAGKLSVEGRGI